MKIAVDFDGVIIDHPDIPTRDDWYTDKPMFGARDGIYYILTYGHDVYVLTNRDVDDVTEWLKKNKFPNLLVTNTKQKGTTIYLDDRAVRFTNWKDFIKYIK